MTTVEQMVAHVFAIRGVESMTVSKCADGIQDLYPNEFDTYRTVYRFAMNSRNFRLIKGTGARIELR